MLVVDDEPLNCSYIAKILEPYSVQTTCFTSYSDAIRHLDDDQDFDLVISDLHIGRNSGFDLIKMARERIVSRRCNYALLTGDSDHSVSSRCSEEWIYYLNKPVSEGILLDLVRANLALPGQDDCHTGLVKASRA